MFTQTVTADELPGVMDRLEREFDREIPLDGFWPRAALKLRAASLECFHGGCDPFGNPWAPVKHQRVRGSGTPQPLRDTDVLMASVTAQNAQGNVERSVGDRLEWGTNLVHAGVHQNGATITARGKYLAIPATLEAAGYPARRFPRPLEARMGEKGGVLVEVQRGEPKPGRKHGPAIKETLQYYLTPSVKIPARPFIGFTPALADRMVLIFDDWLLGPKGPYRQAFLGPQAA